MEVVLVVGLIVGAWLYGYVRGRRVNSVVEMSTRDLKRALRQRK